MWLLAGSQPHALHSLKRFFWRRPIVINHFGGKGASPALPSTPPFTQAPRSHPRPKRWASGSERQQCRAPSPDQIRAHPLQSRNSPFFRPVTEVQTERTVPHEPPQAVRILRALIGVTWLVFQIYIIFYPQAPLLQRPLHLALALGLLLLWTPLSGRRFGIVGARVIDGLLLAGVAGTVIYYLVSASRLTERIEGIDEILSVDVACGLLLIFLLLEGVRRAVGWSLLSVLIFFLTYGIHGKFVSGVAALRRI